MVDLQGKTLDQYQIIELIKETNRELIYKGFQPTMNRYVAFTVLKSQEPHHVQSFTQQTELLAQIEHPNILSLISSGMAEGHAYRVLRYIESGVLRQHLFEYRDPRQAAGLMAGIVAGLEKIHAQGYVHGNLKPDNIYLDQGGIPLLTDFGLSHDPGAPLTPYLSPEQTQGGIVDRRTDVYALGVLLYEILTGEAPPPGVVVSLRAKRPDLPEALERVIFKAMAQNPEARFQSALAFQNALSDALRPVVPAQTPVQPELQTPAQTSAPPPSAPRRTNWAAIILGIVLVVIICGGMVLLFSWWSNREGDDVALEPTATPVEIIPTDEPPEPTQPPEEPEPTDVPEEPEPTQPPEEPEPTDAPEEPGEPPEMPEICNSAGFVGGFFLLGSFLSIRKRQYSRSSKHTIENK
jgi:serine/threonine protein kinase